MDFQDIQDKWKKRWAEEKLFEANPDSREKFFLNAPYPYVNGYLHIGHLYTYMRTEAFARYKRLQGFNVLYPQGWHCTGSPIEGAAMRIREKEEKQWEMMRKSGFSDDDIKKFEKPEYWTEYFPKVSRQDYTDMGFSIDWRREFITTSLNPYYDKFIRWQFRKLKEKGYVDIGSHPVVWDPKTNMPVGDHDRTEGEGETPQEFTLIKHTLPDQRKLLSATLRQDTILGITNVYAKPGFEYTIAKSGDEEWILSNASIKRLQQQGKDLEIIGSISGNELIGQKVKVFGGRRVLVLPATFIDVEKGTGIVHSVPSDSPDDLITLRELQKDEAVCKKYNLDFDEVKDIQPIPVLNTEGLSNIPAADLLEKYKITSQQQSQKLEEAKKELYKLSFYSSTFNDLYKEGFSKNLSGKKAADFKDFIRDELIEQGHAALYYELTGKVITRSLTEAIVKLVENQWFMKYGDEDWKKQVHACLDKMKLYPQDASREQFEYVIDWLKDWACTREVGLGTQLPWEEEWVIESLSDSTIYMAYYTFAHLITDVPIDNVNDELFDYILLGKGSKPDVPNIDRMREEFEYWYPFDVRNSGKDLVQNHLTFTLFNHVAIFPEDKWPKGFGTNGWITVDGEKMSKSRGNMIMLKEMPTKFGVDAARLTVLSGGEGVDDPNWNSDFAQALNNKFESLATLAAVNYNKGRDSREEVDAWAESKLNHIIQNCTTAMEETLFRTGSQLAFFELTSAIKWYLRRTNNNPNKEIINRMIESQLIMMVPFTPFLCDEVWETLGKKPFISTEKWPQADESRIDSELDQKEQVVETVMQDIYAVKKILKEKEMTKVTLFTAPEWKYQLVKEARKSGSRNIGEVLKQLSQNSEFNEHTKELPKLVPRILKTGEISSLPAKREREALDGAIAFLEKEFSAEIKVIDAEDSDHPKANNGLPGKPSILAE